MSQTPGAVHAAIVAAVEAVTGLTEATVPWSLDTFPGSQHDGGFMVVPDGDDGGAFSGGGLSTTLRFVAYLPWRLTGAPNTAAQACADKVHALRKALLGTLGAGRCTFGPAAYTLTQDGHVLIASVPIAAVVYLD